MFQSRIFDATGYANWGAATWTGNVPAGASLQISVRLGNSANPDSTWTPFTPLAGSGSSINGVGRYLQYQTLLATNDTSQTPALNSFSVTPTIVIVVPTTLGDATVADFAAGTPDGGIYVGQAAGGNLSLASASVNLTCCGLPAGLVYHAVCGRRQRYVRRRRHERERGAPRNKRFLRFRSLVEFVATFSGGVAYQDIGFAADLSNPPWAIFGTLYGGGLYARTQKRRDRNRYENLGELDRLLPSLSASTGIPGASCFRSTEPSWRPIRLRSRTRCVPCLTTIIWTAMF